MALASSPKRRCRSRCATLDRPDLHHHHYRRVPMHHQCAHLLLYCHTPKRRPLSSSLLSLPPSSSSSLQISPASSLSSKLPQVSRRTPLIIAFFTLIFLLFSVSLPGHCLISERRGPEFLVEPQSSIVFLNDTGAIVTCSAKGTPAPSITWTKVDGTSLSSVAGLRQIRKDLLTSQLVYLPFSAANYRQDVHSGTIRCVAANAAGAIQSQDVHIRASVKQPFEVQVYDDFAIKGNTGILRCHIPSFVREHVRVTNWLTYNDVQIHSNLLKGGRYSVLPNGELHVHRISEEMLDSGANSKTSSSSSSIGGSSKLSSSTEANRNRLMFRCQTKQLLSGQTKLSANYGRLIVTEPQSRMPPKIIASLRHLVVQSGETVELPCSTQAHPWPTFTWYRASIETTPSSSSSSSSSSGGVTSTATKRLSRLHVPTFRIGDGSGAGGDEVDANGSGESVATTYRINKAGRMVQVDSSLFLRDVTAADSGLYVCVANNTVGQDRFEIELMVRAPLSVAINPSHILATDGETISFNCSVNGGAPVSRVQWRRNARPLGASPSLSVAGNRVHLFENDRRLQIKQVRREDKGMFQCVVSNEFESVQASAELALADDPPAFFYVFSVLEPVKPGNALSVKCSATGVPLPQIVWTLDGAPLADHGRIRVGDYVSSDGVVNSFVNITSLRTEDGGIYSCTASNDVHSISHSGRINVYGPAFVRPMKNLTAISGHNIHLHCPAAGYPLESIVWYKRSGNGGGGGSGSGGGGNRLPQNHRQKSLLNGTLLIEKVDRSSDEDAYRCEVTGTGGGSKATSELFMRVLVAPVISPFSPPPNLREGMRVMLTCSVVEGDSPVLIQFLKDGEPIHEASEAVGSSSSSRPNRIKLEVANEFSATLYIASVTADDSGNYTCIASNMAAVTTYSIVMKVNVPPKWKFAPSDTEAIEGQNVVIDCSASGEPRIWWERAYDKPSMDHRVMGPHSMAAVSGTSVTSAGGPISGHHQSGGHQPTHYFRTLVSNSHMHTLENGSLMIRDVAEEDSGVYLCQANNGVGSGLSKVITLKVHVPAHFKSKFSAQTVQKGDSIEFLCDAFGEPPMSITLAKDRMQLEIDGSSGGGGNGPPAHPSGIIEQTLRTDSRYRLVRKPREDGYSLLVRVVSVDRRDSSLFTCLAANAFGKDEYNFQLIVQEPPSKPENMHILESESRSAVIGWSAPYSGNSPLLAFHIEYRQAMVGSGVESSWSDVSPIISSTNGMVVSSSGSGNNGNSGSGSSSGSKHLDLSAAPGTTFRESISGSENSFSLRGLKPMTAYEFRVQAENKLGLGPFTSILKLVTKEEAPSGPPLNIHVYPLSARALQVTFQAPRTEHQNGQLLGYYVGYKALDVDEHFMFKKVTEGSGSGGGGVNSAEKVGGSVAMAAKEVKITDLRRATKYVVIVQAFNRVGPGPQSEEVIGETLINDPPRAPVLNSVNVDYDTVELSWSIETSDNLLSAASGGGKGSSSSLSSSSDTPEITGYFIYAKSPFGEWEERQVDSTQTSSTFSGLLCGTQYQFYVIAYNNVGKGDPSQAIAVRTKGSAPIAPKNAAAFISTNSTVAILRLDAWLVNGCEIKYFVIKYRPRADTEWLVASSQIYPSQRFVEIVDLKPATWYLLNMASVTDTGTTEETYSFATLTLSGETLPPLDTLPRSYNPQATSSGSASGGGGNGGGFSSIQSLTILIPATCSVIVLTVIIIVACFVLGTKRTAAFESTLLTAIGGGGGGGGANGAGGANGHHQSNGTNGLMNGGRQGSLVANGTLCHGLMGTPVHHGTPLNGGGLSGGCDSEPRYGTVTTSSATAYEHYGFTTAQPGGGNINGGLGGGVGPTFDTFHLSIMGDGGRGGKDLLASNTGAIELNNCSTYATTMKKRPPPLPSMTANNNGTGGGGTLCNGVGSANNGGSSAINSATTCLDSKLIALSEGKLSEQQMTTANGGNNNGGAGDERLTRDGETVHYFQTPYALSRLPRPCNPQQQQQSNSAEDHLNSLEMESNGGGGGGNGPNGSMGCMNGCANVQGTATLRPHHHRTNRDLHEYDLPFPPKWV